VDGAGSIHQSLIDEKLPNSLATSGNRLVKSLRFSLRLQFAWLIAASLSIFTVKLSNAAEAKVGLASGIESSAAPRKKAKSQWRSTIKGL